jgi:predicted CoA-substrate-specific enzyme activase
MRPTMEKKLIKPRLNETKEFERLPGKKSEVFFRIPFLFLETAEKRLKDAWECAENIIKFFESKNFRKSASKDSLFFELNDSSKAEITADNSDLWVRTRLEDNQNLIQDLEYEILKLDRKCFKYFLKSGDVCAFTSKNKIWEESLKGYIGLDAGSISINIAFVEESGVIFETEYTLTEGDVINNIKKGFTNLKKNLPVNTTILGSGVTGSGHEISASLLNADVYETELDAHAEATLHMLPETQVIFDIGGQDSKVMYIEDGELDEAGMNKKCGAGTGAFLDAQADRLGIPIEKFGETGLKAKKPYSFSSMCTVFVGRDLIAEQAKGNTKENIIAGLHRSLAMNFYSTLGINKKTIKTPIAFQGGVASNSGVKKALEDLLFEARGKKVELYIPMHHKVMGAIGMALFAKEELEGSQGKFRGIETICKIRSDFTECSKAEQLNCRKQMLCDLVHLYIGDEVVETLYACEEYSEFLENEKNIELKANFGG